MKFGQVAAPSSIDFKLPKTPKETLALLKKHKSKKPLTVYVGCAKWNRSDLKGFYPRGTKDELTYYATQFNSIEMNATFYKSPTKEQVETWKNKTPDGFKFFPKITQSISHYGRLLNFEEKLEAFVNSTVLFEEKLGMAFLQIINNFRPKDFDRVVRFVEKFPKGYPLAVEVRNEEWFEPENAEKLYKLLEKNKTTNIIVDTPGRRDMLHMRLTTPTAFIRYVGANHPSDYARLDDWVDKIAEWKKAGLQNLYFFIHERMEIDSPMLATHFIKQLNQKLGTKLHIPEKPNKKGK
ncbi:DUF72 domain-containing protein [Sphingobacterium hotanense]|uniref:DUF72 domain-containing protein n=1 Tax=Sphingobacterium hotanense TaxID=649196 RepID=UPI0021A2D211|nr:DUF72 domain-containing protein [Sphingobacterium hotanense]MCT1526316.1 DUF72 domain-containing protein [Sphingobacterium hotanense]